MTHMSQSNRKLVGTVLILLSIALWLGLGTWIYLSLLQDLPWWVHIPYFCLAGLGWLYPAMALIRWMAKPDPA